MLVVISSEAPKKRKIYIEEAKVTEAVKNGLHICRKNQISKSVGNKS